MSLNPDRFPNAKTEGYTDRSPKCKFYNCIAWAAGEILRPWWPNSNMAYWPDNVPSRVTVFAFLRLFRSLGYESCPDDSYEEGYEKIAIYALNQDVKHAARQLPNGHWTSKIGSNIDIEHNTIEALEGPFYCL